jgi:CRISPR-associated endonuclease/helicase Cas3
VRVHWPSDPSQSLSFSALAERLRSLGSALAVVHQRRDARELASLLPPHSRCHLSASMCPAHRLHVLHLVRRRLAAGEPCLLVSTQLVEAGVDIDFPVVYRAMAGLDSLTQAAGRCNREGRRRDADGRPCPGDFFVFRAETKPPPGVLRMAQETAEAILSQRGSMLVLQDPDASVVFFDRLYFKSKLDDGRIQGNRESWNFATVARDFRLIDDYMWPVVVPYGDATVRLGRYRRRPTRETRRALQPHTVSVTPAMLSHLDAIGALERVDDAVIALLDHWKHLYDDEFGLIGEIADERAGGPTLIA